MNRRFLTKTILFFNLLFAAHAWAGYKVTKVIEVGPAVSLLTGGATKWSPDGTKLAYFANNYLMVSDTLGNSRQVAAIGEFSPMRAEWVSNNEFAATLADRRIPDSMLYRLMVYDVSTGVERMIREGWRTRWSLLPGHTGFDGPYVTLEGNAYYESVVITGLEEGELRDRLKSTVINRTKLPLSSAKSAEQAVANNHVQVWVDDRLYSVNWTGTDSTRLCEEHAYGALKVGTAVSADRTMVFRRGHLMNRLTPDTIDIASFAGERPPNTQMCGFSRISFNPRSPELLFEHFCEGGDSLVVDRIATFNYSTMDFTLLDTLAGVGGGQSPVYAPDGRMISFFARGKAYIIWREEEQ